MARLCGCGCKGDISKMSQQAKYLPGHRQRAYQRKRDEKVREALAAIEGRPGVKTTATRAPEQRQKASGKRTPTRYALVPPAQLDPVATVEAHDRRAAARMTDADVVPIPERSLRPV